MNSVMKKIKGFIKEHWKTLAVLAAVAAMGYYVVIQRGPKTDSRPAPEFAIPDLQGQTVHLSDFKGKTVLLDFWATWCGPCLQELPDLKAIYHKYKDRDFVIVGVSLDEAGKEVVSKFVKENDVTYPILLAGGVDKAPDGYSLRGLPTAYLIGYDGMIRKKYTGFKFREELEKDIESILPVSQGG